MRSCRGQVRGHLDRIVCDGAAAEDLDQEVWLRVWQRAAQWDGRGSFGAWVLRIATNLALNHLRSLRRSREQPLEPPAGNVDQDEGDLTPGWMVDAAALGPDEIAAQQEQHSLLRSLVDALPDPARQMVRMVHQHQMDLAEVAEALGIPLGTAKSRLHYAIKRLGRQWMEIEHGED